jgi:hypothetical protein
MSTPKILFLGANGHDTTRLQLGAEVRDIRRELAATGVGEAFHLVVELAVRPNDLQSLLLSHAPDVLHFSGHGSGRPGTRSVHDATTGGASRDFLPAVEQNGLEEARGGLLLEDARGSSVHLRSDVLLALLAILKRDMPLRCVVLNACFTAEQAEAIAEHVDCVVGTAREINDDSAVAFTTAFYRAIAHGKSVGDAFALGRVEIALRSMPGEDVPQLFCRRGIAADNVFVVEKVAPKLLRKNLPQEAAREEPVLPESRKALDSNDEQEKLVRDLDRRQTDIAKRLQDRHHLCALLAGKLETTNTIAEVIRALFDRPAHTVATCLADLDASPNLASGDRDIVRKLLWEALPLAIDWRDVLFVAKKNLEEGRSSVELPLRTETIAEVILAGVDGRACSLVDAKPYPQGTARIPMPSVMHAPFFNMEQHAVSALVKDLVDEKIPGVRSFRDYRGLPTQTDDEIEEARVLVNELLADFSRKDNPSRMPHYLLFIDHLFRKDSSVDLDRLWADLSKVCAAKLPHLRLFRLQGGPKEFGKEIKVVLQIQKPLGKG